MAFNPFASFQKNRKYWMAAVLLMCMITFVLCTGVGGDLIERRKQPRYFETATRLDDLANFLLWLEIADKKDIRIRDEELKKLLLFAVHGQVIGFPADVSYGIQNQVRAAHYGANSDVIA